MARESLNPRRNHLQAVLTDEQMKAFDTRCEELRVTRSELVRVLVRKFLEKLTSKDVVK